MTDEKPAANQDKRKKITMALIAIVGAFLAWQVYSMFGGSGDAMPPAPVASNTPKSPMGNGNMGATPPKVEAAPQVAKPLPMSQREMELLKLQQETQARYVATMNELQMLKLSLEIAETNKDIMAARLDTVKSQKNIVDLLTPEKKPDTSVRDRMLDAAQTLNQMQQSQAPVQAAQQQSPQQPPEQAPSAAQPGLAQNAPPAPIPEEETVVPYTVISVSKIENKWNAVVGVQGTLYSVHVGDVIPADGSRVKSISSGGVVLEKKAKERKISLVPII